MNKSESIINISKALSEFQKEVQNPINSTTNTFFKNKYATLADILNTVRPVLGKYGLSVIQTPSSTDGINVQISTLLLHESGEWFEPEPLIVKVEKATAQGVGSAVTYARRYSLSAILGVASEDDDDGNEASKVEDDKPKKTTKSDTKKDDKKEPVKNELKELIAQIVDKAKILQGSNVEQTSIMEVFKSKGYPNPNKIPSIEIGNEILAELNKLG